MTVNAQALATAEALNPFKYASPTSALEETIAHANANAYLWGFSDACRKHGVTPTTVPDGWAFAWLEYTRRNTSRMAIQDAFTHWTDHGTLPGLD